MVCIITLVFIVLNVRDGTESKYPSIVFLSIYIAHWKYGKNMIFMDLVSDRTSVTIA